MNDATKRKQTTLADAVRIAKEMRAKLWPKCDEAVFWSGKTNEISISGYAQKWAKEHNKQTINLAFKRHHIKIPMDPTFKTRLQTIADRLWVRRASGDVHAILGSRVRSESAWATIERPTLMKSTKITMLTEHHPATTIVTKNVAYTLL